MSVGDLAQPPRARAAVALVLVTITLDMLALSIVLPVLPQLVLQFVGGRTAAAARVYGLFGTSWALMQFIFSPVQGALSDRFGRRPVILISNFGLGFDYVLIALAPSLGWILAARIISGICAGSISAATAYIADIAPPEERAAGYGMVSVAFSLGLVLGPAIGGLLGQLGTRLPFWLAAGLSLANGCYALFLLPESLRPERRARFDWARANPVGALALLRDRSGLLGLAAITFIYYLAYNTLSSVFVLYAAYRYGWDRRTLGLVFAFFGLCGMAVGGLLVRPVVNGLGERWALLIGLACGAAGFALVGFASVGALCLAGIPLLALWELASPGLQSLMTRRVSASEQGRLQGASSSLTGVAGLLGPGLFTGSFAWGIAGAGPYRLPGAPFLLAAALAVAALVLALRYGRIPPAATPGDEVR